MFVVAIFPTLPAQGGFLHFGIALTDVPGVLVHAAWLQRKLLEPVRHGTLRLITVGTFEGIISFPSFHAAAAVLLGWSYSRLGRIGWLFVALNFAMFLSAIPIGGHYLVDVAAGGLLAVLSLVLASRLLDRLGGRPSERLEVRYGPQAVVSACDYKAARRLVFIAKAAVDVISDEDHRHRLGVNSPAI